MKEARRVERNNRGCLWVWMLSALLWSLFLIPFVFWKEYHESSPRQNRPTQKLKRKNRKKKSGLPFIFDQPQNGKGSDLLRFADGIICRLIRIKFERVTPARDGKKVIATRAAGDRGIPGCQK